MQRFSPPPRAVESPASGRPTRDREAREMLPQPEPRPEAPRQAVASVRRESARLEEVRGSKVILENESLIAVLSTAGGRLLSCQMKHYKATGSTMYVELVPSNVGFLEDAGDAQEGPLSVVLSDFPDSARWPGRSNVAELRVLEGEVIQKLPGKDSETIVLGAGEAGSAGVRLTQNLPGGRKLVKTIRIPRSGHVLEMDVELSGPIPESLEVVWRPGVGAAADKDNQGGGFLFFREYSTPPGTALLSLIVKDMLRQEPEKSPEEKTGESPLWVAVHGTYFTAAMISPLRDECRGVAGVMGRISSEGAQSVFRSGPNSLGAGLKFSLVRDARHVKIPMRVYVGPKDYSILQAAGSRLEKVMDFGWFGFIGLPMMFVLKYLHGFAGSFGIAIVLFAVIVKMILWWPSHRGMKGMERMREIQPQLKFINEQYKDDPRRKQEETMRLFRENKVNPLGGCLWMLPQIPIFIALFNVLRSSIELRGEEFLWIQDLATKDPFFILPILMAAGMWFQQKLTPTTGDPQQAKMMQWMPLMFTLFFIYMPAGLVLYWTVQSILQIAQQLYIKRRPALRSPTGGTPK